MLDYVFGVLLLGGCLLIEIKHNKSAVKIRKCTYKQRNIVQNFVLICYTHFDDDVIRDVFIPICCRGCLGA